LEVIGTLENENHVELGEEEVFIGRAPECLIQLSVENVSRKHARITFRNEEYQIEDLGSTNGVYINGIKVEKCTLRKHDQIEIGGVKIIFNEGSIP
jgi:pSer/pThr/pTyr-binding forkhead associated (FHA) protein